MDHHSDAGPSSLVDNATGCAAPLAGGEGDLLTITEAAAILRLPVATLRYWRHRRTGPVSFRVGRGVRYQRSDVIGWLEQQRIDSQADR